MSELNLTPEEMEDAGLCTTCGYGYAKEPDFQGNVRCSYCDAVWVEGEHVHKLGLKVDGLQKCVGHRYLGCTHVEYDSQWGAGIFTDWPRGHHKPYGA